MVLFSFSASALNVQNKKTMLPARTYSVIESTPKDPRTLTFGFGFDYAYRPFEFGDATTNQREGAIVDHLFTLDFGLAYSFSERFSLGFNVPLHVTNGITSFINSDQDTKFALGDISVAGLVNIIKRNPFGLSIMPYITLPTGSEERYVSNSSFIGGFMIIADWEIGEDHFLGLNTGLRFREQETVFGLPVGQELTYALAYEHYLWPSHDINGFAEVAGSVSLNKIQDTNSPFEVRLGVNKTFLENKNLKLTVANGIGIGHGYGAPDYRAGLTLTYDHLLKEKQVVVREPKVRIERIEKLLKELTIYYPTDGSKVDPFYDQKIASIAQILKQNSDLAPLYILGHTDDVGSDAYNDRLSLRRAKQAYEAILQHGVTQDQIVLAAFGEKHPVVPNDSAENRALNRRTLFTFVKPTYMGGSGQESSVSTDSYTEVLKNREQYDSGSAVGKRRIQKGNVIIEEEVKIEKLYDPKNEYKRRGKSDSFIKGRKDDSFTNYLKSNPSDSPEPQSNQQPTDNDDMIVEQVVKTSNKKRVGVRGQ